MAGVGTAAEKAIISFQVGYAPSAHSLLGTVINFLTPLTGSLDGKCAGYHGKVSVIQTQLT